MSLRLNYTASAFRICIDQIDSSHISGQIVSRRLKAPIIFSDINNLISQLDAAMDTQNFPKAFQRARSFSETAAPAQHSPFAAQSAEEMMADEEALGQQGKAATILLHVTMRRNSSWQGFIDWLDGAPRQPFNSTLEFINFLNSKLCAPE